MQTGYQALISGTYSFLYSVLQAMELGGGDGRASYRESLNLPTNLKGRLRSVRTNVHTCSLNSNCPLELLAEGIILMQLSQCHSNLCTGYTKHQDSLTRLGTFTETLSSLPDSVPSFSMLAAQLNILRAYLSCENTIIIQCMYDCNEWEEDTDFSFLSSTEQPLL